MSTFDAISTVFILLGLAAVLCGFVLIANAIIRDALDSLTRERELRRRGRQIDHLTGAPEFFRPRYARNRRP